MKLYALLYGKSKKKMRPIMIDSYEKCDNYKKARNNVAGWHEIIEAPPESETWKQKTCTIGGNKSQSVGRVGHGPAGYVSNRGFNQHT